MLKSKSLIFICFLLVLLIQGINFLNIYFFKINNLDVQTQAAQKPIVDENQKDQLKYDANRLQSRPECQNDINKFCGPKKTFTSDIDVLLCLQQSVYHEDTDLHPSCGQIVWQYKV